MQRKWITIEEFEDWMDKINEDFSNDFWKEK